MKPKSALRSFLILASSALVFTAATHAASLTWDAGGGGGVITNGGGVWLAAGQWNDATVAASWTTGDDAVFGGPATAGGAVTLASPTTVNSLTFNTAFTGTYTLGTAAQAITLNTGITMNAGAGAATIISPITLAGGQTWANNGANSLNATGGLNLGANTLLLSGTGNFSTDSTSLITGVGGGITMNSTGRLTLGAAQSPDNSFNGALTINAGSVGYQSALSLGDGNIEINGGVLAGRFNSTFTRALGSAAGEVRITGGISGFSGEGGTNTSFTITGTGSNPLVWGSTNFAPTQFVLGGVAANNYGQGSFTNNIDLSGTNRTIRSDQTGGLAGGGAQTFTGIISNSTGTAGLIKEGNGNHVLTGVNTYNGGTTINAGSLRFDKITAMPDSGAVTVNTGAALGIDLGAAGDWTGGTSGVGTLGGLLAGVGGAGSSTVVYSGNVGLLLNLTANTSYSGNIDNPSGSTSLALIKNGATTLTLAAGATNSYTGATTVLQGQLTLDGSLTGGGAIFTVVSNNNTNSGVFFQSATGVISGASSFTQNSTGNSQLFGDNSYTGGTTLSQGTLTVGSATALGAGVGTIALNGGTIQSNDATARTFSNPVTIGNNFTVGGTGNLTFSNTGAVALGGNRTIAVTTSGVNATFAQAFSGVGNQIIKNGAGTLTLSGNNSYTGATQINTGGGTIVFKEAASLGGSVAVQLTAGNTGTFRYVSDGPFAISSGLQYFGTTANHVVDRATAGSGTGLNYVFNGANPTGSNLNDISAGTTVNFSAGSNITSGTPTITITNGIRSQSAAGAASNLVASGVNVIINGITTSNRTRTWALQGTSTGNEVTGGITSGGSTVDVTKSGIGTWKLSSSANNYGGSTTITGGSLVLGANNVLPNTTNVTIGTATLDADIRKDTAGTLNATGAAVINLGTGAALAFANSSGVTGGVWAGALNITGTFVPGNDVDPGVGVNPGSIRFGVNSSGLTASQLADISVNGSGAGTYTLDAFGYLKVGGLNTYDNWITANAPATGFVTDSDNDGIPNGVENVLGSNPNTFNAGLTEVSAIANSVIFKHTLNPSIASDVTYSYQWSTDMVEWKASTETNTGGTTATIAPSAPALGVVTVTITITGGPSAKLFGRINVVKAP